jgi:hypothetical protein
MSERLPFERFPYRTEAGNIVGFKSAMSAAGHELTRRSERYMSARLPVADTWSGVTGTRYGPKADIASVTTLRVRMSVLIQKRTFVQLTSATCR